MEPVMNDVSIVLRKTQGIEYVDIEDGVVLKHLDKIHVLNQTACQVFELVDGRCTIEAIIREMQSRYPEDDIETTILSFISQMTDAGLVQGEGRS